MKGMHGICLYPDRAIIELKVRLFNRTQFAQTFLWWANVATRVHEKYQSFFPVDVSVVADHAKRAITSFPLSNGQYYGVDYQKRALTGVPDEEKPRLFLPDGSYAVNDLSWYANIPVPTSYMVTGTESDFFGGYDHQADAGVVHVANHHISPGKKQWTWGNHEFGYAWDRNLTDNDGPYIELMAGVYTDNQPDFSHLSPWETRTFSQYWFPIHKLGVPDAANLDAAISLRRAGPSLQIRLYPTKTLQNATIKLERKNAELQCWRQNLEIAQPAVFTAQLDGEIKTEELSVTVTEGDLTIIQYNPGQLTPAKPPVAAQEPAPPDQISTVEELYLTGVHLNQYRHATRLPEVYWREALRRDPRESRALNAMGLWHLRRGEFELAAEHFEAAIASLTRLNPNPYDGEPYYNLGLTLRYQQKDKEAYDAFYKATWNAAWRGPAHFALAEIDAKNQRWETALGHLRRSLNRDGENMNAQNLLGAVLEKLGDQQAADRVYEEILAVDPLDIGARWHQGFAPTNGQECLDLAFDLLRAGLNENAAKVLRTADLNVRDGSVPMILLVLEYVEFKRQSFGAEETLLRAQEAPLDYCFPSRLEELLVLESLNSRYPGNVIGHYLLGNLLYDRRRHSEAIKAWEIAANSDLSFATVWRNLGIAYFNVQKDQGKAIEAFDRALEINPQDGRILYERDQLWKRTARAPEHRLEELLRYSSQVRLRDDLSIELATLYNQVGRPQNALELMLGRKFQPWEGGEGLTLAQYIRARLLLGQSALDRGDATTALAQFEAALEIPENLGEEKHLLDDQSVIFYWMGLACEKLGDRSMAESWWRRAKGENSDSQEVSPGNISEMSYWHALAQQRLGEYEQAAALFRRIYDFSYKLEASEPNIPYFATSLPAMLLFEDDLHRRNVIGARFLRTQALAGMGQTDEAEQLLEAVLNLDGNHAGAADLLKHIRASNDAITAN
jgi:tetratricopeptide (TPR) repeat protein